MDHERVLAVFLQTIHHLIPFVAATQHSMLVFEFGFQQPVYFLKNIGPDFINTIYIKCCSNNIKTYKQPTQLAIEKPFIVHEQVYSYLMTPFDIRYRLFHLSELVDYKYRYILKDNDSYFNAPYEIIIFFNEQSGRLGLACDVELARSTYKKETNSIISDFFLIHQCLLIVRDLCGMIEPTISDMNTSFIPLK